MFIQKSVVFLIQNVYMLVAIVSFNYIINYL